MTQKKMFQNLDAEYMNMSSPKVFSRTVGKGGECLQKCGKACWEWNEIRDQKNKKEQSP